MGDEGGQGIGHAVLSCVVMAVTAHYAAGITSATLPAVIALALPAAIVEQLAQHAHAARGAMAPETLRALRKTSAAFTAWAVAQGQQALPASVATVAANLDALAVSGSQLASIRQAVWGVAALHRAAGLADPTKADAVRLALKRMARTLGTRQRQRQRLGAPDQEGLPHERQVQKSLARVVDEAHCQVGGAAVPGINDARGPETQYQARLGLVPL